MINEHECRLKFCKVSRNSFSNRCWKFQLSILKNKKVLFLKKNFLAVVSKHAKIIPKDGASDANFKWRFWFWYEYLYKHFKTRPCVFEIILIPISTYHTYLIIQISNFFILFAWTCFMNWDKIKEKKKPGYQFF